MKTPGVSTGRLSDSFARSPSALLVITVNARIAACLLIFNLFGLVPFGAGLLIAVDFLIVVRWFTVAAGVFVLPASLALPHAVVLELLRLLTRAVFLVALLAWPALLIVGCHRSFSAFKDKRYAHLQIERGDLCAVPDGLQALNL